MKKTTQKNLNVKSEIEKIKERMRLDLFPETNIPNSHADKYLAKLDALAALEYAKSLNRPVLHVKPGDCKELREYRQRQKEGYLDVNAVAIKLGVSASEVYQLKKTGKLNATIKNNRFHFDKTEVEKLKKDYGSLIN